MPKERLSMRKIKEVLRLKAEREPWDFAVAVDFQNSRRTVFASASSTSPQALFLVAASRAVYSKRTPMAAMSRLSSA
jgi:hypothetical protein